MRLHATLPHWRTVAAAVWATMASARSEIEIEGYDILGFLGKGAYGEVFSVRDKTTLVVKAAKAVPRSANFWVRPWETDQRRTELLEEEVGILFRLSEIPHRNVVPLHNYVSEPGSPYIFLVMPLLQHGNLLDAAVRLNRPTFLEAEVMHMLKQLADGLAFMHGRSVVHRDLKMENVLVADVFEERPHFYHVIKLADFGFSKVFGDAPYQDSRNVGTELYKSPERTLAPAQDMWSLGVLLLVMLMGKAGERPFLHARRKSQQADLDALADALPDNQYLRMVVRGLLQLLPEHRMSHPALQRILAQHAMPELTNMRPQPFPARPGLMGTGLADAERAARESARRERQLQEENDAILAQHLQDEEREAGQATRRGRPHANPTTDRIVATVNSVIRGISLGERVVRHVSRHIRDTRSQPYRSGVHA